MQNNTERGAGIFSLPLFNIAAISPSAQERPGLQSLCHIVIRQINSFKGFVPALLRVDLPL